MKTRKMYNKKPKTKKRKIYKYKQQKNNKTKKYLGSGPFDKIATTGLSKISKQQTVRPLSTAASIFTGTAQTFNPVNVTPLINNMTNKNYTNYANDMKKMYSEQIKKDVNNQFRKSEPKIDSLYDTINKKSTEELQGDIKKSFNKIMNEYDKWTSSSVPHIEMNEYGRYPDFFKKVPKSEQKPGDIEPYLNQGEETWKRYKKRVGTEEFFRQGQYHKNLYKKEDDEEKEDEEKKFKIEEIDDFVEKSPESPQLIQDISKLGKTLKIAAPLPLFTHMYLFKLEQNSIFQLDFNNKLNEIIQNINIKDDGLREKVIEYNNQTKEQENTGFIGWTKAAALTGYDIFSSSKDYIIQKTAEGVAIAKTKIVSNYVYSSRVIPLGVKTGYGLLDWGLIQSISAIISMSSEKIDWSKTENLDEYNKNLSNILDTVLSLLLKDLTKQSCNENIPKILKHIINPETVNKIRSTIQEKSKTNDNLSQLVDNSNDFCNKILPIVSEQFKKNGFSKGIGTNATELLDNYLDSSLELAKDIVWDMFKNSTTKNFNELNTNIDLDIESNFIYDPENLSEKELQKLKEMYNNTFEISSIKVAINELKEKAYESYQFINSKINKEYIEEQLKEINNKPVPPSIQAEEKNLKENLVNYTQDKVKISDFITNLGGSVGKLLLLWKDEIYKQNMSDNFSSVDCLLNVLDLRINTLLDETCKVYAKGLLPQELCSEKFIELVSNFYTKPPNDINMDDVKKSIKNIVINLMINKVKDKTINLDEFEEKFGERYTDIFFTFDKLIFII